MLPGVQALFAFLLIVPFSNRFEGVSDLERVVYLVALLASTLACVLFITTPSFHRLRFRRNDKEQLLRIGNRCAIAGLALLAVAMVSAVFLVADFLFGALVAGVIERVRRTDHRLAVVGAPPGLRPRLTGAPSGGSPGPQ